jgi:hypothetical protein
MSLRPPPAMTIAPPVSPSGVSFNIARTNSHPSTGGAPGNAYTVQSSQAQCNTGNYLDDVDMRLAASRFPNLCLTQGQGTISQMYSSRVPSRPDQSSTSSGLARPEYSSTWTWPHQNASTIPSGSQATHLPGGVAAQGAAPGFAAPAYGPGPMLQQPLCY